MLRHQNASWLDACLRVSFAVILTGAFVLRVWSLHAGLPFSVAPQEQRVVSSAMGFEPAGDGGAPGSDAVATYVCSIIYAAYYGIGHLVGAFDSILDFSSALFHDPEPFYLLARLASVAAGMLSVWLAFVVGRRVFGRWVGLAASLLVAVSPACVAQAHVADSSAFTLALVLFGWWAVVSASTVTEAIAGDLAFGLCLGLAADAVPAVLLALPVYVAARLWTAYRRRSPARLLGPAVGLGAVCAGLIAVTGAPSAAWRAVSGVTLAPHLQTLAAASWTMVWAGAALVLLRWLRCRWGPVVPAAAALAGALVLAWPGLRESVEQDAMRSVLGPSAQATAWVAEHLPADSTILIDEGKLRGAHLPRSEQSWRRELAQSATAAACPLGHSRAYCLLGLYAARSCPGPAFDIVPLPPERATRDLLRSGSPALERLERPLQYIITGGSLDLAGQPLPAAGQNPSAGGCWLVARFGDGEATADSTTIWGTSAAAPGLRPSSPAPRSMPRPDELAAAPTAQSI